jgi:hypothetical protein
MNEVAPIITQSNLLIQSSYSMTLNEKRVILYVLTLISPKDTEFHEYKIPVKDFSEIFGLSIKATYSDLKKAVERLSKTSIRFPDPVDDNEIRNICIAPEYVETKNKSYVKVSFHPKLKPYLLQLRKLFTSYQLPNVLYMKSFYSIRVYELMKSEEYKNKPYEVTLEKFKFTLNIEDMYNLYSHLRQRIIEPSIKEINTHTDLKVSYETRKKARKVVGLVFHIKKNPSQQMKMYLPLPDNDDGQFVYDSLIHQFQFSMTETHKILREYRTPRERLGDTIRYVLDMMYTTEIRKPKPYLLKCLREDVSKLEREKRHQERKREEIKREIDTIQTRLEEDDQSYRHYVNEVLLVEYEKLTEIEQGKEKDKFISDSPKIMRKRFSENFEISHIQSMFLTFYHKSNPDIETQTKDEYFKKKKPDHQKDKKRLNELKESMNVM